MKVALKFEKRDIWVGVFWRVEPLMGFAERKPDEKTPEFVMDAKLHEIYVCLLPMVPVKVSWIETLKEPVVIRPATMVKGNQEEPKTT